MLMMWNCAGTMSGRSLAFFTNDVAFIPAAKGRAVGFNERLEARDLCCQAATIFDSVVVPAVLIEEIAHPRHGR